MDSDRAKQAFRQYLNNPLRGVDKCPASWPLAGSSVMSQQCVCNCVGFTRMIRVLYQLVEVLNTVPIAHQHYKVDQHWRRALRDCEVSMAQSNTDLHATQSKVPRQLLTLNAGDWALVQVAATGVLYAVRPSGSDSVSLHP